MTIKRTLLGALGLYDQKMIEELISAEIDALKDERAQEPPKDYKGAYYAMESWSDRIVDDLRAMADGCVDSHPRVAFKLRQWCDNTFQEVAAIERMYLKEKIPYRANAKFTEHG